MGVSSSFAQYSLSALAGHYDDKGVISLRRRVVNVMQLECRVMSQKREGFLSQVMTLESQDFPKPYFIFSGT
jgi:hypothetical protein